MDKQHDLLERALDGPLTGVVTASLHCRRWPPLS